jgi:hypothetical protein
MHQVHLDRFGVQIDTTLPSMAEQHSFRMLVGGRSMLTSKIRY